MAYPTLTSNISQAAVKPRSPRVQPFGSDAALVPVAVQKNKSVELATLNATPKVG
jgi:hypothetical protein